MCSLLNFYVWNLPWYNNCRGLNSEKGGAADSWECYESYRKKKKKKKARQKPKPINNKNKRKHIKIKIKQQHQSWTNKQEQQTQPTKHQTGMPTPLFTVLSNTKLVHSTEEIPWTSTRHSSAKQSGTGMGTKQGLGSARAVLLIPWLLVFSFPHCSHLVSTFLLPHS